MRLGLVLSIVLACVGLATCGGASCLGVLNYEPPHPYWQLSVPEATAHPERAKLAGVASGDHDISIFPSEGSCTLAVVNEHGGKVLGESTGGFCHVAVEGHPGDSWSFKATSSAPNAEIQVAITNPLLPRPLGRIALGGVLLAVMAIVGAVLAFARGRRAARTPGAQGSG